MKQYHQKIMVKYVLTEKYIRMHFLFRLLELHLPLQRLLTLVNKYLLRCYRYRRNFPQGYGHHLVFHTEIFVSYNETMGTVR